MRFSKKAGAAALVALAASVALASSGPKDSWDGRHTIDKTSYRALRWAMANSTVFAINTARLAAENDLVDFGAHYHGPVSGGKEYHVYFNFNPAGGSALGDVEALVLVDQFGVPQSILELNDPVIPDDETTPTANRQVNDLYEHKAMIASLQHSTVTAYADTRYNGSKQMRDEDAIFLQDMGTWKKMQVTLVFKNANGSNTPPGLGNIVATVKVENDLSSATVLSVISY